MSTSDAARPTSVGSLHLWAAARAPATRRAANGERRRIDTGTRPTTFHPILR